MVPALLGRSSGLTRLEARAEIETGVRGSAVALYTVLWRTGYVGRKSSSYARPR